MDIGNVRFIMTVVWGILGVIGGLIGLARIKIGSVICIVIGLIATLGMFIPIYTYMMDLGYGYQLPITITLNSSFIIVDPILILLGGILGFVIKEKERIQE